MFALSFVRFFASPVMAAVSGVARRMAEVKRWREARSAYRALCEMDDRNLSDIGLSRSDLRSATAVGFTENPTHVLKLAAESKRRSRSRQSCTATP